MAGPLKIKRVQVGDPGIGFILDVSDSSIPNPLPNLTVNLQVFAGTNSYNSQLLVNTPTDEREIIMVIPFGDTQYSSQIGSQLTVTISASYVNASQQTVSLGNHSEALTAQAGAFDYGVYRSYLINSVNFNSESQDPWLPGILFPDQQLKSANGRYACRFLPNGSLAIYNLTGSQGNNPVGTLQISGNPGSGQYFAAMLSNGNFGIYTLVDNNPGSSSNQNVYSSGTSASTSFIKLNDDGSLCVYQGTPSNQGSLIATIIAAG